MRIPFGSKYDFALTFLPFRSPNRCIPDFANALFKFLAPLGTSDMPKSLGDMEKNK